MDELKIKRNFGIVVRKNRILNNISQEKLAEIVGLHRTYISEVERGERNISLINIYKIAKGLKLTTSELFIQVEEEL